MSKNGKTEVKSWKKGEPENKQTKVNKKRRNYYKRPAEEKGLKADDISEAFPNFSVLTEEERLAFFQALTTARKNVEKRGVPVRTCFGTVHDEYLKYFCQNDVREEEKQSENRSIRSSFTLHDWSNQADDKLDQRHSQERKRLSPVLSLQNTLESPRKNLAPTTIEPNSWKLQDSIIQIETDKIIDLFLKKKKKNEEKAGRFQFGETFFESDWRKRNSTVNYWVAPRFSKKLDTPKFDALTPEEKEVFFKILQEAHDKVIEKNQNKECHILSLDAILRRYLGGDEVTTVFATSEDTPSRSQTKRDLKVTVTVTSRDNERLFINQTRTGVGALLAEASRNYKSENLYPVEMSSDESIEEDKDSTRSEEQDCRSPETNTASNKPCKSTDSSTPMKQIKFRVNETETRKENPLKQGDNTGPLEIQKKSQVVTSLRMDSSENLSGKEEGSVQVVEKNSGETVETAEGERAEGDEEPDNWSIVVSANEETSEVGLKTDSLEEEGQPKVVTDKSEEVQTETASEEKAQTTLEDPHSTPITVEKKTTEEKFEYKETKTETSIPEKQEDGSLKKVSFLDENLQEESSEFIVEESQNEEKNESEEVESSDSKSEVTGKTSVEDASGTKPTESTLNRVMIVNGDVVGKIKRLIYYLEAKANRDTLSEKEYLKLLVDYADYLSKVLESLILKKENQEKQLRNVSESPGFRRHSDDSKKKDKLKLQSSESEFLTCSVSVMDVKSNQPPLPSTKETVEKPKKESEMDLELPSLSDSESTGSEGETRFKHRKDERDRILTTKIRLLQDLLRHRAEFVEGSFDDFRVIHFPEEKFMPKEKPPAVKLLTEDDEEAQKDKKKKFLKSLVTFCTCGKKTKKTFEEGIVENLRGEAVRVDVSGAKKKGVASAILNQSTLEVLKAAERKKIIDKYFLDS